MDDTRTTKAQPRYQDVADVLMKEVSEGKFPIGSMLPTELELCERFDVSRYTVREALRRLEEIGLVGLPRELARNSAFASFDGRSVSLVLSPQFEKLAQRRHVDALGAALSVRHGADVRVDISIRDDDSVLTPSAQREAEAAARQREAEQAIDADPNVQALRDRFGATIEDVSAR